MGDILCVLFASSVTRRSWPVTSYFHDYPNRGLSGQCNGGPEITVGRGRSGGPFENLSVQVVVIRLVQCSNFVPPSEERCSVNVFLNMFFHIRDYFGSLARESFAGGDIS